MKKKIKNEKLMTQAEYIKHRELNEKLMTQAEYIKHRELICPFCKSENVSGSYIEVDRTEALQDMTCMDCNRDWTDIYKLVGFEY